MPWLQAHLFAPRGAVEEIEDALFSLGALSVTIADAGDQPLLEPAPGEAPLWAELRVTGLFEGGLDPDRLRMRLGARLPDHQSRLTLEPLDDQDWERAWLAHFRPLRFGRRLWIQPSGQYVPEAPDQPAPVVVDLDPGLAFGTGTHPTTALCLEWLDGAELAGRTVLDFGCGSGVLAIAALKLGAERAYVTDHDPQALLATQGNAARNGVADRLQVLGAGVSLPLVDLVLANILAGVLIDLAPKLAAAVVPGGRLILSGILAHQADAVVGAYPSELVFGQPTRRDGWVRLDATREALSAC